jgi:hypothetical protein
LRFSVGFFLLFTHQLEVSAPKPNFLKGHLMPQLSQAHAQLFCYMQLGQQYVILF